MGVLCPPLLEKCGGRGARAPLPHYSATYVSKQSKSCCCTHAVPTPTVTLTVLSSEPHVVGGTFSLQCEATVSHHVDTLVSVDFTWRRTSRSLTGSSDSRVTISKTGSDPTYWSILTINELRIGTDSNMSYTCQAVVISDPPSPFILNSISGTSDAYLLDVLGKFLGRTLMLCNSTAL